MKILQKIIIKFAVKRADQGNVLLFGNAQRFGARRKRRMGMHQIKLHLIEMLAIAPIQRRKAETIRLSARNGDGKIGLHIKRIRIDKAFGVGRVHHALSVFFIQPIGIVAHDGNNAVCYG